MKADKNIPALIKKSIDFEKLTRQKCYLLMAVIDDELSKFDIDDELTEKISEQYNIIESCVHDSMELIEPNKSKTVESAFGQFVKITECLAF